MSHTRNLLASLLLTLMVFSVEATNKSDHIGAGKTIERVVLITLDTFRADHLKSYGYPRETAPFISSLTAEGTRFERFIAVAPLTSPAHASLFTSLYPLQHNLLKNSDKLDDKFLTLSEVMKAAGFQTRGFASTDIHFKIGNMDQGFDIFDEMERPAPKFKKKKGKREQVVHVAKHFNYQPATKTINKAIDWLKTKKGDDKIFLWIHLFDAHMPHKAPAPFINAIQKESADARKALAKHLFESQHLNFPQFESHRKKGTIPDFINQYDAEISYIDSELKRLYQFMQVEGLNDDVLWVIAADHGEGAGNHQFLGHDRNIYNEQLRVPLIFHFTSGDSVSKVVKDVVSQVDILPTLAAIVGADLSAKRTTIEGRSLLPFIQNRPTNLPAKLAISYKGKSKLPPLSTMKEMSAKTKMRENMMKMHITPNEQQELVRTRKPTTEKEWKSQVSEKVAIQSREYKYIYNKLFDDELYDLNSDPYETENLIGKGLNEELLFRKKVVSELKRLKKGTKMNKKQKPLDKKTIKKLRSLGYIQ